MSALTMHSAATAGQVTQYLTFVLDGETFGVGILAVKEIIEYIDVTAVPMMPECIRGVINVRGAVVPVMDLVVRFGRPATPVTKKTCIVIVEVPASTEHMMVGMVVDAVNAVIDISAADIEPAPAFGARLRREFIEGMGKVNGKFVVLLNAGLVVSEDDIVSLSQLALDPASTTAQLQEACLPAQASIDTFNWSSARPQALR
jgi:purine-binding chemotaxis protein CheW